MPPDLTVLGLPAARGRWLLVLFGMSVMLCLGSVYAWSVFRGALESELGIGATESLLPYTLALFFYAFLMPVTGFYISRLGPRPVAAIGGGLVGLGYVLSSIATNIFALTLTYGVIAGTGVGITYGVPMAVVAKWFPDKKGLAVGLTIIGFGLSPLITAPLANYFMGLYGIRTTLRILGLAFAAFIPVVALTLKFPPEGWQARPHAQHPLQSVVTKPHSSKLLFSSRSFYGLWLCYAIGAFIGLSVIGISSPVGEEIVHLRPELAAGSLSLFALFNGISRPFFGWLSDHFKPRYVAIFNYTLMLIASLRMVSAQTGQLSTYLFSFCLLWFCLGGWLAIAPTTTLRFFDSEQYAQNYGIVFTAYGVGAVFGTLAVGQIRDWFGTYTYVFYLMAALAIIGIVIASLLLKADGKDLSKGERASLLKGTKRN
ncbi:MAG: OFA family MFS transporter [Cyanobacteria bacterium J06614_10]